MILAFPKDVQERLDRIEADEGIPALEIVHQAVAVWSQLDGDERRRLGQCALGMIVNRVRGSS